MMTPFLLSLGVAAPTAVGTDLVYATITKLTGSVLHYRQRSVNLEVAIFLALGSIPASLLGVGTLELIKATFNAESVNGIMQTLIGVILLLAGVSLIIRSFMPEKWRSKGQFRDWDGKSSMNFKHRLFTIVLGATGGYLVGLTSIGAGSVMLVILLLLYPLAPAVIVGTDVVHGAVLSLVTGLSHIAHGNVDFGLAGMLLLGSVPGVLVGSLLAPKVPERPLKVILAGMIIFAGVRLLVG